MTAVNVDQVVADLRQAAVEIRARGWAQGWMCEPSTGRVCAEGAIALATGPVDLTVVGAIGKLSPQRQERYAAARDAVERHLLDSDLASPPLYEWNDTAAESGEQVAELLETVAAELAGDPVPVGGEPR